jgi:hypothetical protein
MSKYPIYQYDVETHESICVLKYKDFTFTGKANCHPDDADMESSRTGITIAQMRATIKYLQHLKNNELKPKLDALNQLYYSINKSKKHDPNSYEAKMLHRQIELYKADLAEIRTTLARVKEELRFYIKDKEELYTKWRNNRKDKND